ncbi:MarR family transcriptional regulator [Aurantimonas sp. 22II-16-19i]|nr:MarR family transcriptional regulator [Aurantimonas sp. 22II-16-19i]
MPETASDAPRLVSSLFSISKSIRALTQLMIAEIGFYNGQDELLLALDKDEPITVCTLADKLAVRPSTASKMISRLVERGMIEKIRDSRDRRRTMVRITLAGLEAQCMLSEIRDDLEGQLIISLQDDVQAVQAAFERISHILKKRLKRLR